MPYEDDGCLSVLWLRGVWQHTLDAPLRYYDLNRVGPGPAQSGARGPKPRGFIRPA